MGDMKTIEKVDQIELLKNEIKNLEKKCKEYQEISMSWNDRYFELYNKEYRNVDELKEYLESRKLDLLEVISEQKGDNNMLLAAYDGAYEMVVEILDLINEKEN